MNFDEEALAKPLPANLDQAPAQDNDPRPNQPPVGRASLPLVTPVEEVGSNQDTGDGLNDSSDREGEEICIPEDSSSMFFVADTWLSHAPPVIVYTIQMWILTLMMFNLLEKEDTEVDGMVQILASCVSVFTSSDLVDGLHFLGRPIERKYITPRPGHKCCSKISCKWEISNLMRLSEGILVFCTSLAFIAKSEDIVDLFLNFVGVAFVGEMDDGFYKLAAKGIFGKWANESTGKVSECSYNTKKKTCTNRALRYATFALIPIAMLTALGVMNMDRAMEGSLSLYLEHDGANACSVCDNHNLRDTFYRADYGYDECIPFPQEPLIFEGVDGTELKLQIGLNMNETHFSVYASNNEACQMSGEVFLQEGENELISFKRGNTRKEYTRLDFAVLLDNSTGLPGEIVDSGDIQCFLKSSIEEECTEDTLKNEYYDFPSEKSHLTRAWVMFDLKVFGSVGP